MSCATTAPTRAAPVLAGRITQGRAPRSITQERMSFSIERAPIMWSVAACRWATCTRRETSFRRISSERFRYSRRRVSEVRLRCASDSGSYTRRRGATPEPPSSGFTRRVRVAQVRGAPPSSDCGRSSRTPPPMWGRLPTFNTRPRTWSGPARFRGGPTIPRGRSSNDGRGGATCHRLAAQRNPSVGRRSPAWAELRRLARMSSTFVVAKLAPRITYSVPSFGGSGYGP